MYQQVYTEKSIPDDFRKVSSRKGLITRKLETNHSREWFSMECCRIDIMSYIIIFKLPPTVYFLSFGAPSYLRTHLEAIHGAASSWVCDICAKGFSHKSFLEAHRLSHTEEGAASLKRQCEHCKKWLKNAKSFTRHLKRCQSGGPVTCDVCGKEVANEVSLASHKRFYHSEQPVYPCSYCGKIFKRLIRHREHEANHRGEVLYECPFCPYSCNSNSNMYTHKKAAHAEQWAAKVEERFYKR